MKVLLLTQPMPAAPYIEAILALAPELELVEYRSALADAELAPIDIALGWRMPSGLAARMPRLGWVCSTAAGVEKLLVPGLAPHVIVSRIVDPEQAAGIEDAFGGLGQGQGADDDLALAEQRRQPLRRTPVPAARLQTDADQPVDDLAAHRPGAEHEHTVPRDR